MSIAKLADDPTNWGSRQNQRDKIDEIIDALGDATSASAVVRVTAAFDADGDPTYSASVISSSGCVVGDLDQTHVGGASGYLTIPITLPSAVDEASRSQRVTIAIPSPFVGLGDLMVTPVSIGASGTDASLLVPTALFALYAGEALTVLIDVTYTLAVLTED